MDEEGKAYEEILGQIPENGISSAEMAKLFNGRVRNRKSFMDWLCKYCRYDEVAKLFFPRKAN